MLMMTALIPVGETPLSQQQLSEGSNSAHQKRVSRQSLCNFETPVFQTNLETNEQMK